MQRKSHFLLGPRGTGKTKLIEMTLPRALKINLLLDDVYSRLLRRPSLLDEMIPIDTKLVVIDEIQKIPVLLDEVHDLTERRGITFLLTGSSARKLKRGGANLLGGRAWESSLFPLTWAELKEDFDLTTYLNRGGLPSVYFSNYPKDELKNYVKLYLKEEIQEASTVKRLDHFVRFLDAAALANGEELNFEAIASDAGVPSRTVAGYFELLEDTLIGFQLFPFSATKKRKAIKRSKFYFFDVGVAGALSRRGQVEQGSELFGRAFEHFIVQETRAYLSYQNRDESLCYWRSVKKHEVDLVVGRECAVEIKSTERASEKHLVGLRALKEENLIKKFLLVSRDPVTRDMDGITLMPWMDFLKQLHSGLLF